MQRRSSRNKQKVIQIDDDEQVYKIDSDTYDVDNQQDIDHQSQHSINHSNHSNNSNNNGDTNSNHSNNSNSNDSNSNDSNTDDDESVEKNVGRIMFRNRRGQRINYLLEKDKVEKDEDEFWTENKYFGKQENID